MSNLICCIFIFLLFIKSSILFAGEDAVKNCANIDFQTQGEMNDCATDNYHQWDVKLNSIYKKALEKYKSEDKKLLIIAERRWIAYRDAECKFETADTEGGSVHGMVYVGCLAYYTEARIKDLEMQLNCEEGDMSCNTGNN